MTIRVGINGFGRVGRGIVRAARNHPEVEIAWINDLDPIDQLAWLMAHDSAYGPWSVPVSATERGLRIDGVEVPVTAHRDPADVPWSDAEVTVVLDCTGAFRRRTQLAAHLGGTVQRVILSAPAKGTGADAVDANIVMGVNHDVYDPAAHTIVSCASCTTNCLAPLAHVLHQTAGIEHGWMTTIHAYTMDQMLLDNPHGKGDARRARAAALNLVPTTTGAAKAVGLVLPELAGRLDGFAVRVPTPVGSLVDLTVRTERPTDRNTLLAAFDEAAAGPLRGVLRVERGPIVSTDIVGDPHPSILDAEPLAVLDGRLVKALAWYDNEAGFCHQMVRLAALVGEPT